MEVLNNCPSCNSVSSKPCMKSCDYFLTKEDFIIVECSDCRLRFTNPRPAFEDSIRYYDSSDYISHDTSQKGILPWVYTQARKLMLKKKFSIVSKYSKGKRILDIGCGTGEFLLFCKTKGLDVSGVELNDKPREAAKTKYGLDIRKTILDFNLNENKFDCISLWHVLEHIHELNATIESIKKYLKPRGVVIMALPNCGSWDAIHYKNYWAAYDLPRHLYHFNKNSFTIFTRKNKLNIVKILPQVLDAYYISLLSEKYKTGKGNLIKALFKGAYSNFMARKNQAGHSSLIYILFPENS